jgi:hypothetical protein
MLLPQWLEINRNILCLTWVPGQHSQHSQKWQGTALASLQSWFYSSVHLCYNFIFFILTTAVSVSTIYILSTEKMQFINLCWIRLQLYHILYVMGYYLTLNIPFSKSVNFERENFAWWECIVQSILTFKEFAIYQFLEINHSLLGKKYIKKTALWNWGYFFT